MRERLHTAVCMILVLAIFTGCKGAGTLLKVAFVAAYVGVRAIAASRTSSSSSTESTRQDPSQCTCVPVDHGQTWCERTEGEDRCMLQCDTGWNFRDGLCVPNESTASQGQ